MSSDGELFITETCTFEFQKELNDAYGKGMWRLDPGNFRNICVDAEIPENFKVDVYGVENDNKIGEVEITAMHEMDDGIEGKYIVAIAYSIKVLPWTG